MVFLNEREESLVMAPSQDRFDFFCEKEEECLRTRDSDRSSNRGSKNMLAVTPRKEVMVKSSRFSRLKSLTQNIYSVALSKPVSTQKKSSS